MLRRPPLPALLALVALCALAAGCGGDDGADGASVASVASTGEATTGDGEPADDRDTTESRGDAMLDYARCMREHGVHMDDPKPGQGMKLQVQKGQEKKVDAAQRACQGKLRGAIQDLSPEDQAKLRDASLKFAKCMRDHGVDVPDPGPDGRMTFRAGPGSGIDPESPKFQTAQKACQPIMRDALPDGMKQKGS